VIPFFKAPGLGELRRQEYERYHCNEIYNDVNSVWNNVPDICRKYQNSIGYYVFDGAHCKFNYLILFSSLLIYLNFMLFYLFHLITYS